MTYETHPLQPLLGRKHGLRLLHTADWHLGKLLGEHSREEEHRQFLSFLVATIGEHSIDTLLIAGDVFDSANPPQSAVAQYYDFVSTLFRETRCSVVIVAGNHDSPAHLEAPRQILKSLRAHVVGALPGAPVDALVPLPSREAAKIVVAAVPFLRDRDLRTGQSGQGAGEIQRDLVEGIRRRYEEVAKAAADSTANGLPLVATGHLTVTGASTSESEREIHVGGLGSVGADCFPEAFAYVALGHLHRPQSAGGRERVRYSGSPIALSFSESSDLKELRMIEFSAGGALEQTALNIPLSRQLAQIRSSRNALEAELKAFQPAGGHLRPWVEVVVEDPVPGEDLHDLVHELTTGCEFEVIRVVGKRATPPASLKAGGRSAAEGIEQLLGDPSKVFSHRLADEPALGDEERGALKTAFEELRNLHAERQREDAAPAAVAAQAAGGKA